MEKTIKIGEQEIKLKATAGTLRRYRSRFLRDMMSDLSGLAGKFDSKEGFSRFNLEVFENVMYIMAKQADNNVPDNIDDWLDGFDMMSIYEVLPQILELWNAETITLIDSKKNLQKVVGK